MTGPFLERFPTVSKFFQASDNWCETTLKWSQDSQDLIRYGGDFSHLSLNTFNSLTAWPFADHPINSGAVAG